jgi:hypothetical protein
MGRCYGQPMKLGCFGCLVLMVVILALLLVGVGVLFISGNLLGSPTVRPLSFSKADGYAAQQKLYEIVLREAGRSTRKDPITLTEREASAFLSHHLAGADHLPLSDLTVRFDEGEFIAQGQVPLRALLQGPVLSYLVRYITSTQLDQAVWLSLRGRITVEESGMGRKRYGNVAVTRFTLGRQSVSPLLIHLLLGSVGSRLLEWPVPAVVESIDIRGRQAIIRTR